MDSIRDALTWIKNLLDWLPDPVVALLILAIAVLASRSRCIDGRAS